MHQRIAESLDDRLVELGLGAFGDEVDLLAQIGREVVYEALEVTEGGPDGDHADVQCTVAQCCGQSINVLRDGEQLWVISA